VKSQKLILAVLFILFTSISNANAQEELLELDSLENHEPKYIINSIAVFLEQINSFKNFTKAFSSLSDNEKQKLSYEAPFRLDNESFDKSILRLKTDPLYIENIIKNKKFKYIIQNPVLGSIDLHSSNFEIIAKPKRYYNNGVKTLALPKSDDLEIGHFDNDMPINVLMDSIDIEVKAEKTVSFTTITLSKEKPMVIYNKDTFWYKNYKNKSVGYEYTTYNSPSIIENEGIYNGKIIHSKGSSSGYGNPEDLDSLMNKMSYAFEQLLTKMRQDSNLDKKLFIEKYKNSIENSVKELKSNNGYKYKKMDFLVAPQSIKLYIANKIDSVQFERRLYSSQKSDFITSNEENDSKFRIYNKLGETIFEDTLAYYPINDFYFKTDNFYYFFDMKTKSMKKLEAYEVNILSASKVSVRFDDVDEYYIYGEMGRKITDTVFNRVQSNLKSVIATSNNNSWLFMDNNPPKIFLNAQLTEYEHGFCRIIQDEKYGILNDKGEFVVPIKYDYIESFSEFSDLMENDTLFCVKLNNKYGAIDKAGNIKIPMIYERLQPFSYGITIANKDDKVGLINYKNEIIVPFLSSSYAQSSNFGKRSYSLNGKEYNHLGKQENTSSKSR
jgi:hypothetical protein